MCSSLHYYNITLLQRHKAAYFTIFTAIVFSARARPPVRLPAILQRGTQERVCAWAFVKISLRQGQKITLGRVDRHCYAWPRHLQFSPAQSRCMISGERGATSASRRQRSSMSISTHTYLTLIPAKRRKRNSPESAASPCPRWEKIHFWCHIFHTIFILFFIIVILSDHYLETSMSEAKIKINFSVDVRFDLTAYFSYCNTSFNNSN